MKYTTSGYFEFYAAENLHLRVPATFNPNSAFVAAETNTFANQMAGGFNAPAYHTDVRYKTSANGAFQDLNGTWVAQPSPIEHYYYQYSSSFMGTYDTRCAQ
jgi:hypothetical protein